MPSSSLPKYWVVGWTTDSDSFPFIPDRSELALAEYQNQPSSSRSITSAALSEARGTTTSEPGRLSATLSGGEPGFYAPAWTKAPWQGRATGPTSALAATMTKGAPDILVIGRMP
jgi:hypothetical protein